MKPATTNVLACTLFALLATIASSTFADDPIHFIGTASGSANTSVDDITNPAKWGDGVSALSDESDYIIDNGKYCGFGGDGSFPGKSLTLGVVGGNSGNLATISSAGTFDFGTLYFNNGTFYNKLKSATVYVKADVTVNAPSSSPFAITMGGASGGRMEFSGSFSGSGSMITSQSKQNNEYSILRFRSAMTNYTGTMTIGPNGYARTVERSSVAYFDNISIGGGLHLKPCGVVGPCGVSDGIGEFSVKRLTFTDGSTMRFGVNTTTGGTIRVTETLTLPASGRVTLDVYAMPDYNLSVRRHPILIAPAGSDLTTDAFDLTAVKNAGGELYGKLSICNLAVDTSSPDCEILYLEMPKYTAHKTADDYGKSCWLPDYSSHWNGVSAGTPMDSETVYLGYLRAMQTPTSAQTEYQVFPGKRLVYSGRELELNYSVTINDFTVMNGPDVRFRYFNNAHFYGNICVTNFKATTASAVVFSSARDFNAYLDAKLFGPGNVVIRGSLYSYTDSSANFRLMGDNSDLSGKITVTNVTNLPSRVTTLHVSAMNQLGGARTEFAYDALKFSNWSRFRADATLDFNEPTRGVYFVGGNYVNIPTATNTLTLSTQTTLAGTLVKEGSGTLALGGTLKFTSGQSDTPLAGTNVLQVSAGRIKPASKAGADGLAISFAAGTGIRLAPLAETNADVVRYGLYDVKWATPFDLTETAGKLDVALDLPANTGDLPATLSFGVCTVPATAAAALEGNITLPTVRGYSLKVEPVSNGDDTVTFAATYEKRGFALIVR